MTEPETITLYRPVGAHELEKISALGMAGFAPRLPDQPIFYPVTNEEYATQIARDWNTKFNSKVGFVTRFNVAKAYLDRFEKKIVGNRTHEEYWIPAEELDEFNRNIAGPIEVITEFTGTDRIAYEKKAKSNA